MITIFNRSRVYFGTDLGMFGRIRNILADGKISYKYRVKNQMGQWAGPGTLRGRMGSFGQPSSTMYEYEVFVHKDDYEQAMYMIRKTIDSA